MSLFNILPLLHHLHLFTLGIYYFLTSPLSAYHPYSFTFFSQSTFTNALSSLNSLSANLHHFFILHPALFDLLFCVFLFFVHFLLFTVLFINPCSQSFVPPEKPHLNFSLTGQIYFELSPFVNHFHQITTKNERRTHHANIYQPHIRLFRISRSLHFYFIARRYQIRSLITFL